MARRFVHALVPLGILSVAGCATTLPDTCQGTVYDNADKASAMALLKAMYGSASEAFDLANPMGGFMVFTSKTFETPEGVKPIPPRNVAWSFFKRVGPAPTGTPEVVYIAFDMCQHRALGLKRLAGA
jgi:hypothetical protein